MEERRERKKEKEDIGIRRATPEDTNIINEIRDSCWREFYPAYLGESTVNRILEFRKSHPSKRDFSKTIYLILELDGKPIAYISADPDPNGGPAFIKGLYVKPNYVGRGYGSILLNELINNYNHLRLKTLKTNKKAIAFYKSHGFKITGEDKVKIADCFIDTWVMELGGSNGKDSGRI